MRIIGISGVWSYDNPVWINLRKAFLREFPGARMVIEEESGCNPWEIRRLQDFADRLVRKYDDGTETLIVGHSMGGVIACAVADQFTRSAVRGIVSIYAPHHFFGGSFSRRLDAPARPEVPIISFQARYDEVVWWGTRHKHTVEHTLLDSSHQTSLVANEKLAQKIAEITRRRFFPEA